MQLIRRTKTVEGTTVPGIINNGGHYFYINVDVYEDGMVNCWELVDFSGLRDKLASNWLTSSIPSGESLSIHGLGSYKVQNANWHFNKEKYYAYIQSKVKSLNPEMENIYEITPRQKQLAEERRVKPSPQARDFLVERELFYQTVEGDGFFVFMKYEGKNHLVNLVVYRDGRVICYLPEQELGYRMDELETLFKDGTFFADFDQPTAVSLHGLGEAVLSEADYASDIADKWIEVMDLYRELQGEKTTLEACRDAYYQYLEDPTDYYRQQLKIKYELVPEHERMFLGDMDRKDSDFQRIIYDPEQKRQV